MVVSFVVTAFWAMLPVYVLNNVAVLAGGGRLIDGGRTWGGRRILGDDKTWRGTVAGTLAGTLLTIVLNTVAPTASGALGVSLPTFPLAAGFRLVLDVMLGDIGTSLIKRRSGHERGVASPGLGQLDFVIGAFVLAFAATPGWSAVTFSLPMLAVVFVMTSVLHVVTNVGAYSLGLKNEPW